MNAILVNNNRESFFYIFVKDCGSRIWTVYTSMRTVASVNRTAERRTPCCIMKSLTTIKWHPEAYLRRIGAAACIRTG